MATNDDRLFSLSATVAEIKAKVEGLSEKIQESREEQSVQYVQLRAELKKLQEEKVGQRPWQDYRVWVVGLAVLFGGSGAGTVIASVTGVTLPEKPAQVQPAPAPEKPEPKNQK